MDEDLVNAIQGEAASDLEASNLVLAGEILAVREAREAVDHVTLATHEVDVILEVHVAPGIAVHVAPGIVALVSKSVGDTPGVSPVDASNTAAGIGDGVVGSIRAFGTSCSVALVVRMESCPGNTSLDLWKHRRKC